MESGRRGRTWRIGGTGLIGSRCGAIASRNPYLRLTKEELSNRKSWSVFVYLGPWLYNIKLLCMWEFDVRRGLDNCKILDPEIIYYGQGRLVDKLIIELLMLL